jgi:uncharacterized membrane protein (TIGR02234 family)
MTASTERHDPAAGHDRGQLLLALCCCVLGGAVALVGAGRAWVQGRAVQGPLQVPLRVTGSSLAPAVPALAVAALTGGLALIAVRGRVRSALGACLLTCGSLGAAVTAAQARPGAATLAERAGAALGSASASTERMTGTWWPWVSLVGSLLYAGGGGLAALRGARWPGMSARYSAAPAPVGSPAPAPPPVLDQALDQWRALDRGEDPTV